MEEESLEENSGTQRTLRRVMAFACFGFAGLCVYLLRDAIAKSTDQDHPVRMNPVEMTLLTVWVAILVIAGMRMLFSSEVE